MSTELIDLLKKFADIVENYQDKDTIKELVVNLITHELNFAVAGILSIDTNYADNALVTSSDFTLNQAQKILGVSFKSLRFDLNVKENIFAKAFLEKKYQLTNKVESFIPGLNYGVGNLYRIMQSLMNLYGMKELGVFPCFYKGELKGFLTVGNPKKFTPEEIDILNVVANQLAGYLFVADLTTNLGNINLEIKKFNVTLQEKVNEATIELQTKNLELEDRLRKEKDMMDILAHELRTPLSISHNAFIVLEDSIKNAYTQNEKIKNYFRIVEENLKREIKLLEIMLSTTKIDNEKMEIHKVVVDLVEICESEYKFFYEKITQKEINFNKELSEIPLSIFVDKDRLMEIIDNLITNAIKYTNTGQICIRTVVKEGFKGVQIEDTGQGMPRDEIPNLGKKFYRINQHINNDKDAAQTFTRPGGTGLGLYVAFGLTKLMGGTIDVDSELGKGSKFTLWFK